MLKAFQLGIILSYHTCRPLLVRYGLSLKQRTVDTVVPVLQINQHCLVAFHDVLHLDHLALHNGQLALQLALLGRVEHVQTYHKQHYTKHYAESDGEGNLL